MRDLKWIVTSFADINQQGWQLILSFFMIITVGIAFDFLDNVPYWLPCILKSNGSTI